MTTPTKAQLLFLDRMYERAQREIVKDILAGTVPDTVADFVDLQNHVDANTYAGVCDEDWDEVFTVIDDHVQAVDAMQERIDQWLRSGILPLLSRLADQFPQLGFYSVDSVTIDDCPVDAPEYIVAFTFEGSCIVDPYSSDCGRFSVDPTAAYGLTVLAAQTMRAHNCIEYGE